MESSPIPGYSIPSKPPPEAVEVATDAPQRLDRGLFGLAVLVMIVTASLDNLRPPLMPLLAERAGLDHSGTASFIAAVSLGALGTMTCSTRLLILWPQRKFLAFASLLQAAAALTAARAVDLGSLLASGLLWGAGNAALGLSANLLAIASSPVRRRARIMSALHVFYGISAAFPALYLPFAAARMSFEASLLAPFFLLIFPVAFAYARSKEVHAHAETPAGHNEAFGIDASLLVAGLCIYILGEVTVSAWAVLYLVDGGLDLAHAGRILAGFFAALAAGRVLTALFLRESFERILPIAGIIGGGACFAVALRGHPAAIALTGFFLAPVFPVTAALLSADYPKRYKSLLARTYIVMMILLTVCHQSFGWLADARGIAAAFRIPLLFFAASAALLVFREMRRRSGL